MAAAEAFVGRFVIALNCVFSMDELDMRISRISDKLTAVRVRDRELQAFGACSHRYINQDPVSEAEVREFESEHSISLPSDYRVFLRTFSRGGAGPHYGLKSFPHIIDDCNPHLSFRWTKSTEFSEDDESEELAYWLRFPGLLKLSYHGCGYHSLMVVRGADIGSIWMDCTPAVPVAEREADSFLSWYENWLDVRSDCLDLNLILEQIRIGQSVEQVQEICQKLLPPCSVVHVRENELSLEHGRAQRTIHLDAAARVGGNAMTSIC